MFESIVGAIIGAVLGGLIAWYLARWQLTSSHQESKRLSEAERRIDAKLAVEAIISKVEDSQLYRVSPHYEIWSKGFSSLNETRMLLRHAKDQLNAVGSDRLLNAVRKFHDAHRPLIELADSFDQFMADQGANEVQRLSLAKNWPDLVQAMDRLHQLQLFVSANLADLKALARSEL